VTVLVDTVALGESLDAAALDARRKQLLAEREASGLTEERLAAIDEELLLVDVKLRIASPAAEAPH
jgi:hypothetical protein